MKKIKICCFTDVHIHDEYSCQQTIQLLKNVSHIHQPNVFICLGDLFDNANYLESFAPILLKEIESLPSKFLFVFGNHDGSKTRLGQGDQGVSLFKNLISGSQGIHILNETTFIQLGDMAPNSDWENFALENICENSLIFTHGPLTQKNLDLFAKKGARYVFNGHQHINFKKVSQDKKCVQYNISPFRFGGRDLTPAGCAVLEIDFENDSHTFEWVLSDLKPLNNEISIYETDTFEYSTSSEYFNDDPDHPLFFDDVSFKGYQLRGNYARIQCLKDNEILWDFKYDKNKLMGLCPLTAFEWHDKKYIVSCGTWVKINGQYQSCKVIDLETGKSLFDIPCIGVSTPPTFENGVLYISGQWRELIAVDVITGQVIWEQRCETESENLFWRDNSFGSGWSSSPAKVGKHVWQANFRGDLFGFHKSNGKKFYERKGILPANKPSFGTYAYTLGFTQREMPLYINDKGHSIFNFNGIKVNDTMGYVME